jgi:diacylglycerol kinase
MTINSIALISGALSFSAALAWNKAISETLTNLTKNNSPILQAVVITIFIIIIVYIINTGIETFTGLTNDTIKKSTIESGTAHNRVQILNNFK